MISLANLNALITGGSRGIGKACVELFLKAGANVAFTYNSIKGEEEIRRSEYQHSSKTKSYKVNLSDLSGLEKTIKQVLNDFGSIDILVNNAGIWKEAAIDKMT